jgi:hypothetical protein
MTQSPITDEIFSHADKAWYLKWGGAYGAEAALRAALEAAAPLIAAPLVAEVERLKGELAELQALDAHMAEDFALSDDDKARIDRAWERHAAALTAPPSDDEVLRALGDHLFRTPGAHMRVQQGMAFSRAFAERLIANRTKGGAADTLGGDLWRWKITIACNGASRYRIGDDDMPAALPEPYRSAVAELALAQPPVADAGGEGTYTKPAHGWTCFHCGETFTTFGSARDHFGATPNAEPGCLIKVRLGEERGLLMELRKAEAVLASPPVAMPEWTPEKAVLEALKPFARIADMVKNLAPDTAIGVNVSRCRDARDALASFSPSVPAAIPEWEYLTDEQREAIFATLRHHAWCNPAWQNAAAAYHDIRRALTPGVV